MVLVPEQALERLQQRNKVQTTPLTSRLNQLDHEMGGVLNNAQLTDEEKARRYAQTLQNYLTYYNQRKEEPFKVKFEPAQSPQEKEEEKTEVTAKPTDVEDIIEKEILRALPKTLKPRGKLLIDKIRENPDIMKWDKRGQLIFEERALNGSHIADLVGDFLRERKGIDPVGWQLFARGLAKMNAPEDLVRNERRRQALREFKSRQGEDDPSLWLPTPPPSAQPSVRKSRPSPTRNLPTPRSGKTPASHQTRELPQRWLPFVT